MAVSAQRKITLTFSGDVVGTQQIFAAANAASPAHVQLLTLAQGDNEIEPPAGGASFKAVTIVKPSTNEIAIKIKGDAGDVGVRLHDTDPDTISLDSGVAAIILHAADEVVGVRLFWT